jgi:predicted O-linked N-acetylglucosamine transferase (SPINDLY family)
MKPVWALINHHDRNQYHVHLLSDSPPGREMLGYRTDSRDKMINVRGLGNPELCELIQSARIDVLVDLNAYSSPDRLTLFLRRPAPVVIAWFNMYATSGLPGIDYIIGDDQVAYSGEERFFCEQVLRLPLSYLTFEVSHPVPPVEISPCLKSGTFTFGSLVSQYKITPPVLDAWAQILKRSEKTQFLIANAALKSPYNREYLLGQFAHRGVAEERVVLEGPEDHLTFLQKYNRIDLALDAFPYNGGTTTMEALWQGVPVLSLKGDRWASRTSQSLLNNVPLARFIASDPEEYIALAVKYAKDPNPLGELRQHLRELLLSSSVTDGRTLAIQMENLYQKVLQRRT